MAFEAEPGTQDTDGVWDFVTPYVQRLHVLVVCWLYTQQKQLDVTQLSWRTRVQLWKGGSVLSNRVRLECPSNLPGDLFRPFLYFLLCELPARALLLSTCFQASLIKYY